MSSASRTTTWSWLIRPTTGSWKSSSSNRRALACLSWPPALARAAFFASTLHGRGAGIGGFEAVAPRQRRNRAPAYAHHRERSGRADQHRRNRSEPRRRQAGTEVAELVGGHHEHRVHGVDAAAHGVWRVQLD